MFFLMTPNLESEELKKNYRPVSKLHFLSKVLEMLLVTRLENDKGTNHVYDPLQSAYKSEHSTETAITKIHNEL